MKARTKEVNDQIDAKIKTIRELEEGQLRNLELLGALDRFIGQENKRDK